MPQTEAADGIVPDLRNASVIHSAVISLVVVGSVVI
jgi:hypothetical protein